MTFLAFLFHLKRSVNNTYSTNYQCDEQTQENVISFTESTKEMSLRSLDVFKGYLTSSHMNSRHSDVCFQVRLCSIGQYFRLQKTKGQISEYRIYSLLPRFRKITNKFTASGLQAQASLKSQHWPILFCHDMTGEEKQTSCELETCTFQATFILKM